ncbi:MULTISPECIES: ATP-grasp domain-containing protein [Nostocales]|uniref:Carboxylate--amine ligase n=3 Tax=Nostocales TaxID=1161 RepID=A0A0C1R9T8_9CYAN|nr:carboxylate--amine ligase [Tolypothrix bouteillei]KAF3885250.1 carboxylate--amine ligase [Tolypothrix bouteillei VB521301]
MKPFTIAITGINAVDNPGPGTGIARSLREDHQLPTHIIGLAYDVLEPGLYMDWLFDRYYLMPYPSSEPEVLIERLQQIKQQVGLDCVIPNLDVELPLYIRCAKELESLGIRTYLPTREQFALRNKAKLSDVAAAFGVRTPQTLTLTSCQELHEAIATLGLPLMIKGPYYKAYRVSSEGEAIQRFYQLAAEWGYPIIVQQIVSGTELNLVGIGDGKGSHFGLVATKKIAVTELGKIWSGVTIHHPGLLKATEAFLKHTRWKGPFELECIADLDGTIYLIEINPRFPAWTYFATGVGINLPARLVRAALGLPLSPSVSYEAGKLFMRYTYEIVTDATPLQTLVTLGER